MTTDTAARTEGARAVGDLDDDVGGLDRRHRHHPGLQPQLVGGLPAHQRDDPEGPGLDVDLGHDPVPLDPGHQAGEPVSGRRADGRPRLGGVAQLLGQAGEVRAVDQPVAPARPGGLQPTVVGPTAHGVDAHAQQACGFSHPKILHLRVL
jgi:hypothetical protein